MDRKRIIPYGVINWAKLVRECLFTEYNSSEGRCDFLAIPKPGSKKPAQLVEFKYFTNAAAEKGKILSRDAPKNGTIRFIHNTQ